MGKKVYEKDIKKLIESEGGEVVSIICNKHWKARIRRPDGTEFTGVFSLTDSDGRAAANRRSDIRKKMRERSVS